MGTREKMQTSYLLKSFVYTVLLLFSREDTGKGQTSHNLCLSTSLGRKTQPANDSHFQAKCWPWQLAMEIFFSFVANEWMNECLCKVWFGGRDSPGFEGILSSLGVAHSPVPINVLNPTSVLQEIPFRNGDCLGVIFLNHPADPGGDHCVFLLCSGFCDLLERAAQEDENNTTMRPDSPAVSLSQGMPCFGDKNVLVPRKGWYISAPKTGTERHCG